MSTGMVIKIFIGMAIGKCIGVKCSSSYRDAYKVIETDGYRDVDRDLKRDGYRGAAWLRPLFLLLPGWL